MFTLFREFFPGSRVFGRFYAIFHIFTMFRVISVRFTPFLRVFRWNTQNIVFMSLKTSTSTGFEREFAQKPEEKWVSENENVDVDEAGG